MEMDDIESDTAHLLGSSVARRGKRRGGRRGQEHVSNGQSMSVLSDPEGLMSDEAQEVQQLKRLKILSGSHDTLPSVRAQLASMQYAESKHLHTRSTKETTPLLSDAEDEKGGGPDDGSADSIGLKGSYDSLVIPPAVPGKNSRFGATARKG